MNIFKPSFGSTTEELNGLSSQQFFGAKSSQQNLLSLNVRHSWETLNSDMEVFSPLADVEPTSSWSDVLKEGVSSQEVVLSAQLKPMENSSSYGRLKHHISPIQSTYQDYSLPEARSQGLDIGTVHLLPGLSRTPSASRTEGDNNPLTVQESFNGNMQDAGLFAVTSNISRADLEEDIDLRNSSYSVKGIRSDDIPVTRSIEQINRSPRDRRRQNVHDIAYVKQNKNDVNTGSDISNQEDFQTTVEGTYVNQEQVMPPFALQLVQHALDRGLEAIQKEVHNDVKNLHLEILRQFHMQHGEMAGRMEMLRLRLADLVEEVQALRGENQLVHVNPC